MNRESLRITKENDILLDYLDKGSSNKREELFLEAVEVWKIKVKFHEWGFINSNFFKKLFFNPKREPYYSQIKQIQNDLR